MIGLQPPTRQRKALSRPGILRRALVRGLIHPANWTISRRG
ncbi:MAG: hypothetical protein ACR2QA_13485 [Solirubrobacteraceae bacterium]